LELLILQASVPYSSESMASTDILRVSHHPAIQTVFVILHVTGFWLRFMISMKDNS